MCQAVYCKYDCFVCAVDLAFVNAICFAARFYQDLADNLKYNKT